MNSDDVLSDDFLQHFQYPCNRHRLDHATMKAMTDHCGQPPRIVLYLVAINGIIEDA